jgi:glycosyltransferase involved in cell wall biosynthesis
VTVSVVVPVYNGMPYVVEALQSVLQQTHTDVEVVLLDNASTDGTAQALADVDDDRVRVVRNSVTLPAAENWNKALDEAQGEWVKLLCADDVLAPTCIEEQLAAARAFPSAVLIASQRRIITAAGTVAKQRHGLGQLDGVVDGAAAVRACVRAGTNLLGEPAAVLLKRDVLTRTGGFDPRFAYMIDLELWCRVLAFGPAVALRAPLADFRVHGGSWSSNLSNQQFVQARELFRQIADHRPEVTDRDYLTGLTRAAVMAKARRVAYAWWARLDAPAQGVNQASPSS